MDWIDRIAILLKREPPPQYQQQPGAPYAAVYMQQQPRRKISRGTMIGVGVLLAIAFFFVKSASNVSVPQQKPVEFPSFDVDTPGIKRPMASLRAQQTEH